MFSDVVLVMALIAPNMEFIMDFGIMFVGPVYWTSGIEGFSKGSEADVNTPPE